MMNADTSKKRVGEAVVKYIKDGMMVGLGSDSTMIFAFKGNV